MTERRRTGRPPLDPNAGGVPSADVHLTLAAKDYDRAYQLAKQHRETIGDLIRRAVKRLIADERGTP